MAVGNARETALDLVKQYRARKAKPVAVWGIPFGIGPLDYLTGGTQYEPEGACEVLISRPKAGKSALVGQIAKYRAEWLLSKQDDEFWKGKVIRGCLMEMGRKVFERRLACMLADVSGRKVQQGTLSDAEEERYMLALQRLASLPIEYLDKRAGVDEIAEFIRKDGNCAWWWLDHIGLVDGANERTTLEYISNQVMDLCHKTAPGLVVSHQNRQSVSASNTPKGAEPDYRPTQESVAGSDQIAKNADLLLGIYRPDMFKKVPPEFRDEPRPGEIIIITNRHGNDGTIHMFFNPRRTEWVLDKDKNQWFKGDTYGD